MMVVPDHTCQPVRVERDQGTGYSFELDHVYADRAGGSRRAVLVHDASYWQVTQSKTRLRKTLTFATAVDGHDGKLTFERFSSLDDMRDELLALFE